MGIRTLTSWFGYSSTVLGLAALLAGCNGAPSTLDNNGQGTTFPPFAGPADTGTSTQAYPDAPPTLPQLQRGRYILTSAGCTDCHSATGDDPTTAFWLAGFVTDPTINPNNIGIFPQGALTSFASNLTPDTSGIAEHSPLELFNGLRTGQHHHNFGLLCPPMAWPFYTHMQDADIWSVVAYLKSLAPVQNVVSFAVNSDDEPLGPVNCNNVPVPLNEIASYPAGNEIEVTNTSGSGLPNGPSTVTQVLAGRYIVTAVAACGACHNRNVDDPNDPNWLAGFINSPTLNPDNQGTFQIGPDLVDAANITPDMQTGIGSWSSQDIFNALRLGHDNQGNFLFPPMPWSDFRNFTDSDIWSIVAYLQSIKPVSNAVPAPSGPVPAAAFYAHLPPFPLAPYPTQQEINPDDPASDQ